MPCSFCGTVGHNRRTCQRFDLLVAAATEEQINVETEDNNMEDNNMEDDNQTDNQTEEIRLRINNERIIRTARHNLMSIMNELQIDLLHNNHNNNPFITPTRSRSPSPPHAPERPLTMQPISDFGEGTATMLLTGNMPHGLTRIPSFDDIANLFNDANENGFDDDLPDLIPIEPKNLPDCVQQPCSTDSCAICLDKLSKVDLFVTRCGHQYHGTCMIQHIKKKNNCPLCRGLLHV